GIEDHLLAGHQPLLAEVLLRHPLGHVFAALAVGIGRGHLSGEAVASLTPLHGLLQARDDVAVAEQDRQRLPVPGTLRRLLRGIGAAALEQRVMEADDAVFFDLHGWRTWWGGTRPRLSAESGFGQDAGRERYALSGLRPYHANPA